MSDPQMSRFATSDGTSTARNLHQFVVNDLGAQIAAGVLAEGTRIYPEALAESYGASRTVVREALRVLEAKGMLRPRPRVGTRVLAASQWNLLDQDVISWRLMGPARDAQLDELTDLRFAVEIYAARKCAKNATGEHIATLRNACDIMEKTGPAGDADEFTRADIVFHATLLEASGNMLFNQFATPFAAFLHARVSLHTLPSRVATEVIDGHRQIVDAIEGGIPEEAENRARELIEQARDELHLRLRG